MLDALRFAARLGLELGRLGLDRIGARTDVPRTIERVDASWLEGALSERFPGVRVRWARILSEDSGTTARRRLAIDYEARTAPGEAPSTVFVKARPPGLFEQLFGRVFDLGPTEVAFYRDVRPALPIQAPDCFTARLGAGGEYVLLLEDLVGAGAELKTIADPITLAEAEAVVDSLAMLHAAFWGPPRFEWLRRASMNPNAAVERFVCARAHKPTLERFAELLPEGVRRGAARIHTDRRLLDRYWADGPSTLIHGDSHVGNMYFARGEAGLFDWQVTQHHVGIRDVAYFVMLSLDTDLRREHERALLDRYRRQLFEHGVAEDDARADWLWERYRSFSLYAYVATSVTATMSDLQPAHVARLGLERAAAAVDDLDGLELLERIG